MPGRRCEKRRRPVCMVNQGTLVVPRIAPLGAALLRIKASGRFLKVCGGPSFDCSGPISGILKGKSMTGLLAPRHEDGNAKCKELVMGVPEYIGTKDASIHGVGGGGDGLPKCCDGIETFQCGTAPRAFHATQSRRVNVMPTNMTGNLSLTGGCWLRSLCLSLVLKESKN